MEATKKKQLHMSVADIGGGLRLYLRSILTIYGIVESIYGEN